MLVFEVYSEANWRIILCMISRATTGMCGSEKLGTSEEEAREGMRRVLNPWGFAGPQSSKAMDGLNLVGLLQP